MHNCRVQSVLVPERATAITASGDTMPIAGGCDLEICLRYPTRVWRRKSGRIPLYCSPTLPRRPLGMRTCMPLKPAACAQASITATYVTSSTSSPPWLIDARFCCAHFSIQPTQGASPTLFPCEPVPGSFLTGEMLLNTTLWFLPKRSVVVRTPSAHPRTVSILLFLSALHDLCHPGRRS